VVIAGKKIDTPCYIWKNRTGMNLWNVVLAWNSDLIFEKLTSSANAIELLYALQQVFKLAPGDHLAHKAFYASELQRRRKPVYS